MLGHRASLVGIGLLRLRSSGDCSGNFWDLQRHFTLVAAWGIAAALGMYFIVPKQALVVCVLSENGKIQTLFAMQGRYRKGAGFSQKKRFPPFLCPALSSVIAPSRIPGLHEGAAVWNSVSLSERVLEDGRPPQFGFNLQEAVVLGNPLAAASRSGLDLAAAHGHREIRQEGIFRFP